eukprot:CAMPEP_0179033028 /NCGR_PEP_ID=MMETSP0796-20121207/11894_1 /TAXON_ID=73915 /ORGANISM="Pyrodinium bahamense, Strain pbaha01" /LENGTH=96 /DNA_ID=CAMNT_0020729277 /DNA_START=26 /DNA_END=312 /DNA_ORIENTATION=+
MWARKAWQAKVHWLEQVRRRSSVSSRRDYPSSDLRPARRMRIFDGFGGTILCPGHGADRDLRTFTRQMQGWGRRSHWLQALRVLARMCERGPEPDA